MKRVIIICEGPTEQEFCKTVLRPPFQAKGILIQAPLIKHSRGGIVKWPVLKQQIQTHLKVDRSACVTTFIDYYGLYAKHSFPDWEPAERIQDKNARMDTLETGMHGDIDDSLRYRFIPYLQLHEFEGLLFNDINIIYGQIPPDDLIGKPELEKTFADFENPEMINNDKESSPSHRLKRIIKGYNKVIYATILAETIGLERIRNKSPRFHQWINKIESI